MITKEDLLKLPVGTIVHWLREEIVPQHSTPCRPALLVEHVEGFMGAPLAWLAVFEPDGDRRKLAYWAPQRAGWHPAEDCAEVLRSAPLLRPEDVVHVAT